MISHAQGFKDLADPTGELLGNYAKKDVEEQSDKKCREKGDNLVAGNTACIQSDADIHGAHEQHSEIAAQYLAQVNVSQISNRYHIGKCESQRDDYQQEGRRKL